MALAFAALLFATMVCVDAQSGKPPPPPSPSGGGGGKPPPPPAQNYDLEIELYVFGSETKVAYGGECQDSCAAAPIRANGNNVSSEACPTNCVYRPYKAEVKAVQYVAYAAAKNATNTSNATKEIKGVQAVNFAAAVTESCTQKVPTDCSVRDVACPRGVCDPVGCTAGVACAFTPEWVVIPKSSVKYNIRSEQWPFCGTGREP